MYHNVKLWINIWNGFPMPNGCIRIRLLSQSDTEPENQQVAYYQNFGMLWTSHGIQIGWQGPLVVKLIIRVYVYSVTTFGSGIISFVIDSESHNAL